MQLVLWLSSLETILTIEALDMTYPMVLSLDNWKFYCIFLELKSPVLDLTGCEDVGDLFKRRSYQRNRKQRELQDLVSAKLTQLSKHLLQVHLQNIDSQIVCKCNDTELIRM